MHIHHQPGRLQVEGRRPGGRTLEGDEPADGDEGHGRDSRGCADRPGERAAPRAPAARHLDGDARFLRRDRPERVGEPCDAPPELPAAGAPCEMRLEERAVELRELGVETYGKLLAGSRAVGRQYGADLHRTLRRGAPAVVSIAPKPVTQDWALPG